MRSDSARFLDRMFCADQAFGQCDRPWRIQAMASAFGWNDDCSAPHFDCGQARRAVRARCRAPAPTAASRRWRCLSLTDDCSRSRSAASSTPRSDCDPPLRSNSGKVLACAAGADGRRFTRDDWGKCGGGVVVDVVAEGWGQGHARASALGVAGMMATLAAAANGQDAVQKPHLVAGIARRRHRRRVAAAIGGNAVRARRRREPDAHLPRRGRSDPERAVVFATARGRRGSRASRCSTRARAAASTGSPARRGRQPFPNDDRSLDELWRLCGRGEATTKSERAACGPLRPYKWYVAAYRTDRDDPRWTKVDRAC